MTRSLRLIAVAGPLALAACASELDFELSERASGPPARYIVGFEPGVSAQAALRDARAEKVLDIRGMNAAAFMLPPEAVSALERNPSIAFVEEDHKRYLLADTVPYGIEMVQAHLLSDEHAANRKVCVIDSGYYIDHVDLQTEGVTAVPNAGSGDPFIDPCAHGTHVTGTIAALANGSGVLGVLPSGLVELHIVKVFGDDDWSSSTGDDACDYTHTSRVINAAQECAAEGAHVVNMSLGGGNFSSTEAQAFQALFDQGVLLVAAAGNSANTELSYPASYDAVISVAAIDQGEQLASFSQRNAQVELAAPGVSVVSTTPLDQASLEVEGRRYPVGYMSGSVRTVAEAPLAEGGLCDEHDASWDGRVVLCARGEITFADKARNVAAAGGVGVVIYNNAPGNFQGTLEDAGAPPAIPAISLSQADGLDLVAEALGVQAALSTELNIPSDGYEAKQGTSMASPHVAGVAALIWSYDPSWTNREIREALVATAKDLGTPGRNDEFGHGLVQARAALDYLTGECSIGISNIETTIADAGAGRFAISWETDLASSSEVTFACCGTYTDGEPKTSHRMVFDGAADTSYEFTVGAQGPTGCAVTAEPGVHEN